MFKSSTYVQEFNICSRVQHMFKSSRVQEFTAKVHSKSSSGILGILGALSSPMVDSRKSSRRDSGDSEGFWGYWELCRRQWWAGREILGDSGDTGSSVVANGGQQDEDENGDDGHGQDGEQQS